METESSNAYNIMHDVSRYALNIRMVLLAHLLGTGSKSLKFVCGLLGLSASNTFSSKWRKLEQKIGTTEMRITDEILFENRTKETVGLIAAESGKFKVDVSGDMGWQKRGKGFDSLTGHCMLIGDRTGKVLCYKNYSKSCKQCQSDEKTNKTTVHDCSKNYDGSSKGMEAHGLFDCVLDLWKDTKLVVDRFVIDDDATTKSYVRHSYKELVSDGRMDRKDWPRTEGGNEKKDTGRLPLDHPPVEFCADLNHRIRQFGGALWALARAKKSESIMTVQDAQRMKRNFSFWIF